MAASFFNLSSHLFLVMAQESMGENKNSFQMGYNLKVNRTVSKN